MKPIPAQSADASADGPRALIALIAVLVGLDAACSGGAAAEQPDQPFASDLSGADSAAGGVDVVGAATLADGGSADGGDPAVGDLPSGSGGCPGAARCPCAKPEHCESGLCIDNADGGRCAATCQSDSGCEASERCVQTTLGGDAIFLCAPRFAALCAPCRLDADCQKGIFSGTPRCLDGGEAGHFCSSDCDKKFPCPNGFSCSDGACVPDSGTCTCSSWAITHASATDCTRANVFGACHSVVACTELGKWPTCAAKSPKIEACDGQDENCNGLTDDGAEASCDDNNGCTTDLCQAGVCQHASLFNCGDGVCADTCGESAQQCPLDCHVCGDGKCQPGESPKTCKADCCGACGDGKCIGYECGESPAACPSDCGKPCGDQLCEAGENPGSCPADCASQVCGNHVCEPSDGGPITCPEDCAASCGNCVCEKSEDFTSCPNDCGFCGDGLCSVCAGLGETKASCFGDCSDFAGVCSSDWQVFCADTSACTDDACVYGKGCVHLPSDATCSDGNACTVGDVCNGGACTPGGLTVCDDGNACTLDGCDLAVGCTASAGNGLLCSDGDSCTFGDTCLGGTCKSGIVPECTDGNACTDDGCKAGTCVHAANAAPCSDGNACTLGESCAVANCSGATAANCADGNGCTVDLCDAASGCKPASLEGAMCSDGDPCTVGDACAASTCVSGAGLNCDDGQPCTDDACSANAECVHLANGASCSDENACTGGDHCTGGICLGVGATTCDDENACTIDYCDGASAVCVQLPVVITPCDDGTSCTKDDLCLGGDCVGQVVNCDDGNACTSESCVNGPGCVYLPAVGTCTDGVACTFGDVCLQTTCVSGAVTDCDDGDPCTVDLCSDVAATGCSHGPDDAASCVTASSECPVGRCVAGQCLPKAGEACAAVIAVSACDDAIVPGICTASSKCVATGAPPPPTCPGCAGICVKCAGIQICL